MPEVVVSARLATDPARVWALVSDMEAFPRFMPSVESLRILERGDGYTLTEWVCRLQGMRFRWTERDEFLPAEGRIVYRLVSGDLARFEGDWRLTPPPGATATDGAGDGAEGAGAGGPTELTLTTRFEFGLPMLAPMLDPVAKVMLRKNVEAMLAGLQQEAARNG
jgi:coenzyme Q-binding protein COQ10